MKMKKMGKKTLTLKLINSKKRELYTIAKHYDMTHPIVVACSQDLDRLLNQYEGIDQYKHVI
ncbi:aspartyl-phosphate phosphatase Spo0E family protein [Paenisporosarcina sp. TG20]|uniref:aspartyl-phosphate phosphatase Spo0E family protein n=1 Tax=Paenisporosarcina sp. TG20 TaxID=1211706 RepID=UPI0003094AB2|nr:aspartyl-phosphate phosphatase Spo0E family protein [Paenisporosarcina sp. TG20]